MTGKALRLCTRCQAIHGPTCPNARPPFAYANARRRDPAHTPSTAMRNQVLRDHNHQCAYCGSPATQIDHAIPVHLGGITHPDNLQPICDPCHDAKSRREQAQRQHPRRPRLLKGMKKNAVANILRKFK